MASAPKNLNMPTTEPDADGFYIPSEIKQSAIPNAGRGRFFVEDHKKGTVVRKQVLNSSTLKVFRNVQDVADAGLDMEYLGHFGHSTPKDCDLHKDVMFINTPPMHSQHSADSDSANIHYLYTDTEKICVLMKDVKAGDEFMQDYTNFKEVKWFEEHLNSQKFKSPRQFGTMLETQTSH